MNQSLRDKKTSSFYLIDTFIRIPLLSRPALGHELGPNGALKAEGSGILIKCLSLRPLRLRGEIVFGQD